MPLLKTLGNKYQSGNSGTTLFEIIIVLSLIIFLFSSAISGFETNQGFFLKNTRNHLVSVLQTARSQSMSNICFSGFGECFGGKSHGVHFESDHYVLFQGNSWLERDEDFDNVMQISDQGVVVSGNDVIFSTLSGDSNSSGSQISVSNQLHSSNIFVSSSGQIIWDN